MGLALQTQQSMNPERVKTIKAFKLKPNIIYLKNSRDQMMLMTEKAKDIP